MIQDELICPFMSRPIVSSKVDEYGTVHNVVKQIFEVTCIKERCTAWGPKIVKHPNCPGGDWDEGCKLIP